MNNSAFLDLHDLVIDKIKSVSMVDSSTNNEIMKITEESDINVVEERIDAVDSYGNVIKSFYKTRQSGISSAQDTSHLQMYPRARICTQCGAPLHSNKCEYCDTEYI